MKSRHAVFAGVAGHGHKNWGSDYTTRAIFVRLLALGMMGIAIGMAVYAALNFRTRGKMLLCAALRMSLSLARD